MITTLLFTTLFVIIWYYLRDLINYYKTGDPNENNQNYWMFSYDFKDDKDFKKYWDKDTQSLNQRKRIRNKLIFTGTTDLESADFIYTNYFYETDIRYNKKYDIPANFYLFKKLKLNDTRIYSIYKNKSNQ